MIICAAIKDTRTGAVFGGFSSKYEVVKQEGLIYTIVEKTNEG